MALEWACAVGKTELELTSTKNRQRWLQRIMRESCDSSAPKHRQGVRRKQVYWWSEEIAASRKDCNRQRRLWCRSARGQDEETKRRCEKNYRRAKKLLRRQIKAAKSKAWQELIADVNRDPWGLPYRIVLKKLKGSSPGLTETLDEGKINKLLESLFPRGVEHDPFVDWVDLEWNEEEWGVTYGEVEKVLKKRRSNNKAPGPDGVGAIVVKSVPTEMVIQIGVFRNVYEERRISQRMEKGEVRIDPKRRPTQGEERG